MMSCPNCDGQLIQKRTEVIRAGRVEYNATVYQCATEDVWVTVEVPKTE